MARTVEAEIGMGKILDVIGNVARMEARRAAIRGPSSESPGLTSFAVEKPFASLHPGYLGSPCLPNDYSAPKGALKTPGEGKTRSVQTSVPNQ